MEPLRKHVSDEMFMRLALREAEKYAGLTGTNPVVGCVLASRGRNIASGAYKGQGFPHAEIAALRSVKNAPDDCALYVTLEPCCNFSRTPPCVDGIIRSGIKRVIIGCLDRNPAMSGESVRLLKNAGVYVRTGVLEKECEEINRVFFKTIRTKLPYVTLKIAMTMDGKIAPSPQSGRSGTITSFASRRQAHRLRRGHDAVLTGAGTILSDNPRLTIRHVPEPSGKKLYRVVLDSRLRVPAASNIFRNQSRYPALVAATNRSPEAKRERLHKMGVEVVIFPETKYGVDAAKVLSYLLSEKDITSVLVEGGTGINRTFIEEGLADRVVVFLAPRLMGDDGAVPAFRLSRKNTRIALKDIHVEKAGEDVCFWGDIEK